MSNSIADYCCPVCGGELVLGCNVYSDKELTVGKYQSGKGALQGIKGAVCLECGGVQLYVDAPLQFKKFSKKQ